MNRQIVDSSGNKMFDARVHIKNAKGQLAEIRPYTRYFRGDQEYSWDKKTKKFFYSNGEPIARQDLPEDLRKMMPEEVKAQPAPAAPAISIGPKKTGKAAKMEAPKASVEENPEPALQDSEHPSADAAADL